MTYADTILALCDFLDTHPHLAEHQLAVRPGPDDDSLNILTVAPDGTPTHYIIGAPA